VSRAAGASGRAVLPHHTRAVLANGLTVIFGRNDANPTLALYGVVKAGAIFDPAAKTGLASFTASMLDRGTASRTSLEQAEALEDLGASLHFEGGAETVSISCTALSEDLGTVLAVLADALSAPAFASDQIEKARDEQIVRVRVHEEHTGIRASRAANQILYPKGHPFHESPIGTEESLRSVTRDDLVAFHARHYGPNTTVLALVGDVEQEKALQTIEAAFGAWGPLASPPAFEVPRSKPLARITQKAIPMKGKSQVDVVYAVPGVARTDPGYYGVMLMNYILGGGSLSSRLMDNLRDRQGLVYGVYSNLSAGIGAGPIQIHGGTNPANAERTAEGILTEVRGMLAKGPTRSELDEAKSYLTGVFPVRLETNGGVANQLLGAELYGLGMDYIERYPSILEGVTLEDVRAAAGQYLSLDAYALVTAGTHAG